MPEHFVGAVGVRTGYLPRRGWRAASGSEHGKRPRARAAARGQQPLQMGPGLGCVCGGQGREAERREGKQTLDAQSSLVCPPGLSKPTSASLTGGASKALLRTHRKTEETPPSRACPRTPSIDPWFPKAETHAACPCSRRWGNGGCRGCSKNVDCVRSRARLFRVLSTWPLTRLTRVLWVLVPCAGCSFRSGKW